MSVPVLDRVPGQVAAMAFLRGAIERPHHAYVFAGPEGSGKSLAARAFAAALLCRRGGCGECRDCRLAEEDHHPNQFVIEPEGRDIHVETIRDGGLATRLPNGARAGTGSSSSFVRPTVSHRPPPTRC